MWQEERQQKIRNRLKAFGQISIDRVVSDFGVSRETIRRDLMEMEKAGLLRRIRGGAVRLESALQQQSPFQVRHTERRQEKRAIAATALQFLTSGMTIFMEAGSTAIIMAETLAEPNGLKDITIITNSVDIGRAVIGQTGERSSRFRVIMLGGEFKQNPMEMTGANTINAIHNYHADLALLVPWGINAEKGAFCYHFSTTEITRAMVQNADKTIILADHSKIGAPSRAVFCSPDDMAVFITDRGAREVDGFDALYRRLKKLVVAEDK